MDFITVLRPLGYVPVIEIDNVEHALPLAEALVAGGIGCIEVTLRTEAGLPSIQRIAKANLPLLVGAGTITRTEHAQQCADAGARFGVSPGFTPALGRASRAANLPLLPGTVTPSEVLAALEEGFDTLKFFPASIYGGVAWLKAIGAPIAQAKFIPTGGISDADVPEYLALKNVIAFGSSAVASRALINEAKWSEITSRAQKLMSIIRTARPQ